MRQRHYFAILLLHKKNFGKLSLYKSNLFENFEHLKIMFELDLLQVNVICFKNRFSSTCTGATAVFYVPPNHLYSTVNAN